MGWKERDWARFNEDERRRFFGEHSSAPGVPFWRKSVGSATLVFALLGTLGGLVYELSASGTRASAGLHGAAPIPVPQQDVVAIRWRTQDLAPASNAGRICVRDARRGSICAAYVVGERPADNLTRELARRGLRVQSG